MHTSTRAAEQTIATTVVVISHNYGRFLRHAAESVLGQTRAAAALVIDDGSIDETPHVAGRLVAESGGRVLYRRHDRAVGLAEVRNDAARRATSEWIVYLDADDWLASDFVEKGEDWLAAHRSVDVLTTDMIVLRDGCRPFTVRARAPSTWPPLLRANTIVQTSFIRRSLILRLGGYDRSLDFEDWDFWIRALKAGGCIARLPGPHVFRREHGQNKSKTCDERAAAAQVRDRHPAPLKRSMRASDVWTAMRRWRCQ